MFLFFAMLRRFWPGLLVSSPLFVAVASVPDRSFAVPSLYRKSPKIGVCVSGVLAPSVLPDVFLNTKCPFGG